MNDYLKKNTRLSRNPDTDTRMMIDFLGMETFNIIRSALGGAEIKVPYAKNLTEDHLLVRRLGWDVAQELCEAFPSSLIYVPKGDQLNQERDAYIVEAVKAGIPRNEIALNLNISTRWLRHLLGKLDLADFTFDKAHRSPPTAVPAVSNAPLTHGPGFSGASLHSIH